MQKQVCNSLKKSLEGDSEKDMKCLSSEFYPLDAAIAEPVEACP